MEETLRLPFQLRDLPGQVRVSFEPNEDPLRWGYGLLNLDYPVELARGFPVVRADVSYPAEGYAALFGWIQIVRYTVNDGAEIRTVFDVPPQLGAIESPYLTLGILPTLFDAPSITNDGVIWDADSFLVHTPDALMTPVVHAICGFTWGYRVRSGQIELVSPVRGEESDWDRKVPALAERYPRWRFGSSWAG